MKRNNVTIVYDGECPFCSDFVSLNRLKQSGYNLKIVNARESNNTLIKNLAKNYDLDYGMIVILDQKIFYGSSAASFISSSFNKKNIKSSLYYLILVNKKIAKITYPVLVFLRKIFFRLTGKKFINDHK